MEVTDIRGYSRIDDWRSQIFDVVLSTKVQDVPHSASVPQAVKLCKIFCKMAASIPSTQQRKVITCTICKEETSNFSDHCNRHHPTIQGKERKEASTQCSETLKYIPKFKSKCCLLLSNSIVQAQGLAKYSKSTKTTS